MVAVEIVQLDHATDLPLPSYESTGAAGMDLYAAISEPVVLKPGERNLLAAGISIALPHGYEAQIRPRSGLALKHGLTCLNSPGTIDSDYRGEIKVILINHGNQDFTIARGERIAQMVIAPVIQAVWQPVDELSQTKRGSGGFGSTGK